MQPVKPDLPDTSSEASGFSPCWILSPGLGSTVPIGTILPFLDGPLKDRDVGRKPLDGARKRA